MLGSFSLSMLFPNSVDVFIAHLFDADAFVPELRIARASSGVALSWPVEATNHVLEAASSLPAISWDTITNTPAVTTNERSVQLPITSMPKFFRLRKQ
jgi:hypothetical protein